MITVGKALVTSQACATTRKSTQERNPINAPFVRKALFRGQTSIDIKGFIQVRNLINVPTAASSSAGAPASTSIRDHTGGRSPSHSPAHRHYSPLQPCSALPGRTSTRNDLLLTVLEGEELGTVLMWRGCCSELSLVFPFAPGKGNKNSLCLFRLASYFGPCGKDMPYR